MGHPLVDVLAGAADGRFPPADGGVDVLPSDRTTVAVVALTGHAYVLADVDPAEVAERAPDGGFGSTLAPEFLVWLAAGTGAIGSVDAMLVGRGTGSGGHGVAATHDHDHHPRVRRAHAHRDDVTVFAGDHGVVVLGSGLVGRRELSVELFDPATAPAGAGRALIAAGLGHAPAGAPVWAQVSPGNARSLRAFLACGFHPVGSEVLVEPRP